MKFEEVIQALREGKKIKYADSAEIFKPPQYQCGQWSDWQLSVACILRDDWKIVEEKPLPCPFCGSNNVKANREHVGCCSVVCYNCEGVGPSKGTLNESIEYWNKAVRR